MARLKRRREASSSATVGPCVVSEAVARQGCCVICLEDFAGMPAQTLVRVLSKCQHAFCEDCLQESWRHGSTTCPMCRRRYPGGRDNLPAAPLEVSLDIATASREAALHPAHGRSAAAWAAASACVRKLPQAYNPALEMARPQWHHGPRQKRSAPARGSSLPRRKAMRCDADSEAGPRGPRATPRPVATATPPLRHSPEDGDVGPSHVVWAKLAGCPWWPAYKSEPATAAQRDMR